MKNRRTDVRSDGSIYKCTSCGVGSLVTPPITPPNNISFILQAQPVTAWSSACPRRRKELTRVEQAQQDQSVSIMGQMIQDAQPWESQQETKTAAMQTFNFTGTQNSINSRVDNLHESPASSQSHSYNLRRTVQPSTMSQAAPVA